MISFLFYRGGGGPLRQRIITFLIRVLTGRWVGWRYRFAAFTHVEVFLGRAEYGQSYEVVGASERDGLVRRKSIFVDREKWEIRRFHIPPEAKPRAQNYVTEALGLPYDYRGALACGLKKLGLPITLDDKQSLFCSEFAMGVLNAFARAPLDMEELLSPQEFFEILEHIGQANE